MAAILSPLRVPLQALAVALGGVGLAWLYFNDLWWVGASAAALAAILGLVLDGRGKAMLPARPVGALRLMEAWLLVPLAVAAVAAALVVVATVELTLPETAATATKKLVGGVSTGITTFLTAAFITWTGDSKSSALADHIREAF